MRKICLIDNLSILKTQRFMYISILLKLDCCLFVCLFVCLSGLYYSDGGIETAFIIEVETNLQILL